MCGASGVDAIEVSGDIGVGIDVGLGVLLGMGGDGGLELFKDGLHGYAEDSGR